MLWEDEFPYVRVRQVVSHLPVCFCNPCWYKTPEEKRRGRGRRYKAMHAVPSCLGMLSQGNETRCLGIAMPVGEIHLQVGRSPSTCIFDTCRPSEGTWLSCGTGILFSPKEPTVLLNCRIRRAWLGQVRQEGAEAVHGTPQDTT